MRRKIFKGLIVFLLIVLVGGLVATFLLPERLKAYVTHVSGILAVLTVLLGLLHTCYEADEASRKAKAAEDSANRSNKYWGQIAAAVQQMAKNQQEPSLFVIERSRPFKKEFKEEQDWVNITNAPQRIYVGWLQNMGQVPINLNKDVKLKFTNDDKIEVNKAQKVNAQYFIREIGSQGQPGEELVAREQATLKPWSEAFLQCDVTFEKATPFIAIVVDVPCKTGDLDKPFYKTFNLKV